MLLFTTAMLAIGSGAIVGLVLGLIGGGGSILAVPLLVYAVGVTSPHVAIGTSAVAVAASALVNLVAHARTGVVKWNCAIVFALAGMGGALAGAALAKSIDGSKLLALFGVVMILVGAMMLRRRNAGGDASVRLTAANARRMLPILLTTGLGVGLASGFFGIGGGFLVVPGLMFATGMPLIAAIGSSLVAVTAFGATTASSYAASGLVNWWLAGAFILGGLVGGSGGVVLSRALAGRKQALSATFATVVIAVGLYILVTAGMPLLRA
jgi:uncharacterized membrane protein YfcA